MTEKNLKIQETLLRTTRTLQICCEIEKEIFKRKQCDSKM